MRFIRVQLEEQAISNLTRLYAGFLRKEISQSAFVGYHTADSLTWEKSDRSPREVRDRTFS